MKVTEKDVLYVGRSRQPWNTLAQEPGDVEGPEFQVLEHIDILGQLIRRMFRRWRVVTLAANLCRRGSGTSVRVYDARR
jgi:hypothetical protein